ncbi:MAG: methylenetetrahydrofolate reductase C-terminal domain-containing protein [Candidatus Methanoperedens sp.]|nr:methylenetetrahydrofolate reductase C-terminal domain-containing protein [Candidatus Methanoperedens sp.]MCE8426981.1 methylenetetrahydrofolate reductase C-terminal domain-containing protein [Candidatus Methanoperedens sp.]
MIISKQKEFDVILRNLKEEDIFIIGCGKCAKKLRVGGEPEVLQMKTKLEKAGKNIIGWTVLSSACYIRSWEEVLTQNPAIKKAHALLVMSCGGGISVISGFADIPAYPALDTESLGGTCCEETVKDQCGMCGDCIIWMYGGICPLSQCAKTLLNGPCGGAKDGKCEVDDRLCVWDAIFERLKKIGKLEYLDVLRAPRDHTRNRRSNV